MMDRFVMTLLVDIILHNYSHLIYTYAKTNTRYQKTLKKVKEVSKDVIMHCFASFL